MYLMWVSVVMWKVVHQVLIMLNKSFKITDIKKEKKTTTVRLSLNNLRPYAFAYRGAIYKGGSEVVLGLATCCLNIGQE